MITIGDQTTRQARVNSDRECLTDFCPAQTHLTCAARVNFHEHAPGAFSLVREHEKKVGPSGIVDRLREHSARQSFNVQILDCDKPILIDDLPRFLVMKISTLIADVAVKPSKQQYGFAPSVRTLFSSCHTPLQSSKLGLCGPEPSRVFDLSSIAQCRKRVDSYVYADHVRVKRQRRRFAFDGKQGKPSSRFALDRQGFYDPFDFAVQSNPHGANLEDSQSTPLQNFANVSQCHAVVATDRTKSWIARALAIFYPAKESTKGQVDSPECCLKRLRVYDRHVWTLLSDVGYLGILIEPGDRFTLALPRIAPFLQSSVVKFTAHRKLIVKDLLLAVGRIDAVAKRLDQVGPYFTRQIFAEEAK